MGRIHVLPGEVVSRIAAGEVIERPAAVVKELIENSLDAGSTTLLIEVKHAGLGLIRVVDDGEGMSRADATVAFARHATSKLMAEEDLWAIRTRGFRGEALPSIASISRIRLMTARPEDSVGTRLVSSGGVIECVEDVATPRGSQIEVSDLFFNTPARKKFLKTAATEFSHIAQAVQQASLAAWTVQFRLRHNGQDVLELPAVPARRDRVRQVYRDRFVEQCQEIHGQDSGLSLEGYVIKPVHARTGRSPQDLFVNSRPVKNAMVSHAVYDGYESFLPRGRHPQFMLFLEVDPARVDVNVHPAKREVRFLDQELIHREVRRAVRASLTESEPQRVWSEAATAQSLPASALVPSVGVPPAGPGRAKQDRGAAPSEVEIDDGGTSQTRVEEAFPEGPTGHRQANEEVLPYQVPPEVTPLGQVARTFLVAEVGTELHVVDQHTAHERVLFERLHRAWSDQAVECQPLLIPEPFDLPAHDRVVLQQHLADLEKLGLVIEPFGANSFVIRAVPAILGSLDYGALAHDVVEDLAQWNSVSSLESRVRPLFATLACHGAVRAGRGMNLPEIKRLVEDWVGEGLPMTCPHGRRVALRLSMDELAKVFGRA